MTLGLLASPGLSFASCRYRNEAWNDDNDRGGLQGRPSERGSLVQTFSLFRLNSRILLMQYFIGRALFRIFVRGEMIAAASTIHDITEVARSFGPDTYQVDEVIDSDRVENRQGSRFWGWVTHRDDGIVAVEPCLSVLEG